MSKWNAHRFNSFAPDRQSEKSSASSPAPSHLRQPWVSFVGVGAALLLLRTLGARGPSSHAVSYSAFLGTRS
jgi:hypothetical protein